MRPIVENRLIWSGCSVALLGTVVCGYLAASVHWTYGVAAALLIPLWVFVSRHRAKAEERGNLEALHNVFQPSGHITPILRQSRHYGHPGFKLVFSSKSEFDAAMSAGLVAAFKAFVQNRYADFGSKENPFDVERAVDATYEDTNRA